MPGELDEVMHFYNDGAQPRHPAVTDPMLDPGLVEPLGLTDDDVALARGVFELSEAPLDPEACRRRVEHDSCGAVALPNITLPISTDRTPDSRYSATASACPGSSSRGMWGRNEPASR